MSEPDNLRPTTEPAASQPTGALAKLSYYVVEFGMELYYFVYGLFFASTKKDQEDEDERWRARKRRS